MASEDNELEDSEFVTQVIEGQLYERFWRRGRLGRESLSGPEYTALLVWRTRELVGNGGMALFHQGNLDVSAVIKAFQELGFSEAAKAIADSLAFFPADVLAGGSVERSGWIIHVYHDIEDDWEGVMERVADFFQPFTDVIMELDPDGQFGTQLATYIRTHLEEFVIPLNTFPDPDTPRIKPRRFPNRAAMLG